MKILILCPRFPYPLEKGDKLRIYHQIRLLSEKHEICLVSLSSSEIPSTHLSIIEDITNECHVIHLPKRSRVLSAIGALFSRTPLQVAYYKSRASKRRVRTIIEKFKPDHIYCQLVRMSSYVEDLDIAKTLDYMDAFGVGMARRASVSKGIDKLLYTLEAKRIKRYEATVYTKFDHHTIISEQDRKHIGDGKSSIYINPNGIDTAYFTPMDVEVDHDIAFVGNMGYLPNVQACEYLVKELKLAKKYKILLAGARPTKSVQLLASSNVTITGWVDDVRQEYARSKVFVAPLWSGTGQQNKILEAMAMGIPCITTKAVNNAIGARHDKEILIANDQQEFVAAIERLLSDEKLYQKIKENGRRLVTSSYSWQNNVNTLESIFNKK